MIPFLSIFYTCFSTVVLFYLHGIKAGVKALLICWFGITNIYPMFCNTGRTKFGVFLYAQMIEFSLNT